MSREGNQDTNSQTIARRASRQLEAAVDHTLARIVPWTPINWPRGTASVAERTQSITSIRSLRVSQLSTKKVQGQHTTFRWAGATSLPQGSGATTLDIIHLSAVPLTQSAADSDIWVPPVDTVSAELNDVSLALGNCVTCLKHKLECNRQKPKCCMCLTYNYNCKYTQRFGSRRTVHSQDQRSVKLQKLLPAPLGS